MQNSPLTELSKIYHDSPDSKGEKTSSQIRSGNFSNLKHSEMKAQLNYTPLNQKSKIISGFSASPVPPYQEINPIFCCICNQCIEKGTPIHYCLNCSVCYHHNCFINKNISNDFICDGCKSKLNTGIFALNGPLSSLNQMKLITNLELKNKTYEKHLPSQENFPFNSQSIEKTSPMTNRVKHISPSNVNSDSSMQSINSIKRGNLFGEGTPVSEKEILVFPQEDKGVSKEKNEGLSVEKGDGDNIISLDTNINDVANYGHLVQLAVGEKMSNIKAYIIHGQMDIGTEDLSGGINDNSWSGFGGCDKDCGIDGICSNMCGNVKNEENNSNNNINNNNNISNISNNNCNNLTAFFGEGDKYDNINNFSFGPNSRCLNLAANNSSSNCNGDNTNNNPINNLNIRKAESNNISKNIDNCIKNNCF